MNYNPFPPGNIYLVPKFGVDDVSFQNVVMKKETQKRHSLDEFFLPKFFPLFRFMQ